jgi:hypothetical protein
MTLYYTGIRVLIDPEQSDPLPDGGRLQDVSLVLSDEHGQRAAAIALAPAQVRELAFDLLELAERAEQTGGGR